MACRSFALVISLAAVGSILAAGCATEEDIDETDGYLKPRSINTLVDQRKVCVDRTKENGAQRDKDLAAGVVRWKCGDVKGVTAPDLGQEYCEFHALQDGKVVDKAAKSSIKPAKVECVFTGVYRDVKGEPGSDENQKFGAELNKALTDGEGNLRGAKGIALPALGPARDEFGRPPNPFSVMNGTFNARGAASKLLADCEEAAKDSANAKRVNAASDQCSGDNCASPRDVEACTLIMGLGEGWRNSDPVICGRAARGALCGASYGDLPPVLDGFLMTDWNQDIGTAIQVWAGKSDAKLSAPDRCRYATINGKQYPHIMICTPTETEVNKPEFNGQLQQMCSSVFGPKIAMTAPIGLVAKLGSKNDGFCGQFNAGAQNAVSKIK
jgi:hypothetical protein